MNQPNNQLIEERNMANVRKGNLTPPPQWWKHLKEFKRVFWKAERKAQRESIKNEADAATRNNRKKQ